MNIIKYIILAIIQGITEPLPISSSGHIILFKAIFNTTIFNSLNYEIITNFGSFVAIFLLFFKDIKQITKELIMYLLHHKNNKSDSFILCCKIIISILPVGIIGFVFKDKIESINNIYYLALAFLFTSGTLFIVRNINGSKSIQELSWIHSIIIGLFQAVTIMPGISRSGTVLVACLLCKLKKEDALKYTFLLYLPVSIAALILGLKDFISSPNIDTLYIPYILSFITAFFVTYISYKWMAKLVLKGKLMYFAIYCLFIATFIIIYFH